jgi:N-glycosylase/DNA lyase
MEENKLINLLEKIEKLKIGKISKKINLRLSEFKEARKKDIEDLFQELCFCILCANYSAERSFKIQLEIGNGFCDLEKTNLVKKLKNLGYRYPNIRAQYIVKAREHIDLLKNILVDFKDLNELREWLVKNIKGIGYKEASHFLRNIGFHDFAIIDFHIIKLLTKYGLINNVKTLTEKKYLEIEDILRKIGEKTKLSLAELDLYLWYIETGKILK